MSLHRLAAITVGVPDPESVVTYYGEFGLDAGSDGALSTVDGGRQLVVEPAATRRLIEIVVEADDRDDLEQAAESLMSSGHHPEVDGHRLAATEPVTGVRVRLNVASRLVLAAAIAAPVNGPARAERLGQRAPAVLRNGSVRPRKLGHAVTTSTDLQATSRFFIDLGFQVSDFIGTAGIFLRCSTDHHNLVVLSAPAEYLHHTAWQVDDVDEVGRGAFALLEQHPDRHVWGLGRHHAGSNFFWYLRDPAGSFSEYYADLDVIPEDAVWTPEAHPGRLGLYSWGPPPPPQFLHPEDLADLVAVCRPVDA